MKQHAGRDASLFVNDAASSASTTAGATAPFVARVLALAAFFASYIEESWYVFISLVRACAGVLSAFERSTAPARSDDLLWSNAVDGGVSARKARKPIVVRWRRSGVRCFLCSFFFCSFVASSRWDRRKRLRWRAGSASSSSSVARSRSSSSSGSNKSNGNDASSICLATSMRRIEFCVCLCCAVLSSSSSSGRSPNDADWQPDCERRRQRDSRPAPLPVSALAVGGARHCRRPGSQRRRRRRRWTSSNARPRRRRPRRAALAGRVARHCAAAGAPVSDESCLTHRCNRVSTLVRLSAQPQKVRSVELGFRLALTGLLSAFFAFSWSLFWLAFGACASFGRQMSLAAQLAKLSDPTPDRECLLGSWRAGARR